MVGGRGGGVWVVAGGAGSGVGMGGIKIRENVQFLCAIRSILNICVFIQKIIYENHLHIYSLRANSWDAHGPAYDQSTTLTLMADE